MNLDMIRRRHKWLTLGILIVISVAFIFGIGSFVSGLGEFSGGTSGSAAKVNGEEIGIQEYLMARRRMTQQFSQGQELPQAAVDLINYRALQQLIEMKLLAQKAKELGFVITDEEFVDAIQSSFQENGLFVGGERYKDYVENQLRQNLAEFEENLKDEMLAEKLVRFIAETVVVTDEKLLSVYNLQNETINLEYIEFSNEDFVNSEDPSDEEIEKYYEKNKGSFKTDESRKMRYVILEPENFENGVQVTEEELTAYYNAYPEEFRSEDGTLIPFEEAKESVASKLKSQRAELVREKFLESFQLSQNTDISLEQIAKDNSVESVSESKDFTISERTEDIPPQIVSSAFSLEKGTVSVIPVGASIWVIEVSGITESHEMTLEEIKPEIVSAIKDQKAKNTARKKANETLIKLKATNKEGLSEKTKEMGLTLSETGPFKRTESVPVLNIEQVKSDAFKTEGDNNVLGTIYESNNNFYVVIVKERMSANPGEFELKKAELMEKELEAERYNVLDKWLQTLRREATITTNEELFPSQG